MDGTSFDTRSFFSHLPLSLRLLMPADYFLYAKMVAIDLFSKEPVYPSYPLFFNAHGTPKETERIQRITDRLAQSPSAVGMMDAVPRGAYDFFFKDGENVSGFGSEVKQFFLSPVKSSSVLLLQYAHELTHIHQLTFLGPTTNLRNISAKGIFAFFRILAADSWARPILYLDELRERGDETPYSLLKLAFPETVIPYEQKKREGGKIEERLRAAFFGFFKNPKNIAEVDYSVLNTLFHFSTMFWDYIRKVKDEDAEQEMFRFLIGTRPKFYMEETMLTPMLSRESIRSVEISVPAISKFLKTYENENPLPLFEGLGLENEKIPMSNFIVDHWALMKHLKKSAV